MPRGQRTLSATTAAPRRRNFLTKKRGGSRRAYAYFLRRVQCASPSPLLSLSVLCAHRALWAQSGRRQAARQELRPAAVFRARPPSTCPKFSLGAGAGVPWSPATSVAVAPYGQIIFFNSVPFVNPTLISLNAAGGTTNFRTDVCATYFSACGGFPGGNMAPAAFPVTDALRVYVGASAFFCRFQK